MRIPKDFEFPGDEAIIVQDGNRLILKPVEDDRRARLKALFEQWRLEPPLGPEDDFPEIDDPPPEPFNDFDDL